MANSTAMLDGSWAARSRTILGDLLRYCSYYVGVLGSITSCPPQPVALRNDHCTLLTHAAVRICEIGYRCTTSCANQQVAHNLVISLATSPLRIGPVESLGTHPFQYPASLHTASKLHERCQPNGRSDCRRLHSPPRPTPINLDPR